MASPRGRRPVPFPCGLAAADPVPRVELDFGSGLCRRGLQQDSCDEELPKEKDVDGEGLAPSQDTGHAREA